MTCLTCPTRRDQLLAVADLAGLTPRERDCWVLVELNESYAGVSVRLNISSAAVEHACRRARAKVVAAYDRRPVAGLFRAPGGHDWAGYDALAEACETARLTGDEAQVVLWRVRLLTVDTPPEEIRDQVWRITGMLPEHLAACWESGERQLLAVFRRDYGAEREWYAALLCVLAGEDDSAHKRLPASDRAPLRSREVTADDLAGGVWLLRLAAYGGLGEWGLDKFAE